MTLSYSTANDRVPSRVGLTICGVIILLASLYMLFIAVRDIPSPNRTGTPDLQVAIGRFYHLVSAAFGVFLAVNILRARRWVRPVMLGYCVYAALDVIPWIPQAIYMNADRNRIDFALGLGSPLAILGITYFIFEYFRRPFTQYILNHYKPAPSWTDRYPLSVLAVGVVLARAGIYWLQHAIAPIPYLISEFTLLRLTFLAGYAIVAILLAIPCLYIYRGRYSHAYRFAVVLALLVPFAHYLDRMSGNLTPTAVLNPYTFPTLVGFALSALIGFYLLFKTRPAFFSPTDERNFTVLPPAQPLPVVPIE